MVEKEKKIIRKTPKAKAKKPSKYDEKIVINGSFEELVKELVTPKNNIKAK